MESLTVIGDNAKQAMKRVVERVEALEEQKSNIADDIKMVYTEAKAVGFDTKILRQVIRRRKMDRERRDEIDQLLSLYENTIESVDDLL